MRKASFWTPERIEELRRCFNREMTSAQMAEHFGTTIHAVRKASYKHKITSRARHAFNQSRRMKGRKDSAETRQRKAEAMRRKHADPVLGPRIRAKLIGTGAKADHRKANDTRRGFHVPDAVAADYQILRRKLGSAQEAGRMLGLVGGQGQ